MDRNTHAGECVVRCTAADSGKYILRQQSECFDDRFKSAIVIRKAFEIRKPAKLSQPALEVLTIIAYYQPATRAYVDQIRGVDSSYTMGLLLDRGLIEECGRLQVPGRPRQYRTTKQFLRAFHLTSLDELPEMPDLGGEGQMRLNEAGEVVDPTEGVAVTGADGPETAGLAEPGD